MEILFLQVRQGLPHLLSAVEGGVVHDHHARDAAVRRQGVLQKIDQVLALPGAAGRPPGQGRRLFFFGFFLFFLVVGTGGGQGSQYVHALSLGALVGDFGPAFAPAPGVGGGQAGAEPVSSRKKRSRAPARAFF